MTGIYKITNIITGKCYIGSSIDIQKRWIKHKSDLNKNKHHSSKLQNSYNKYGADNFIFKVIEECECVKEILLKKEDYYSNLYDAVKNGYSCAKKSGSPMFGKKHSEATKLKISESNKGRKQSQKLKNKLKEIHLNNKYNIGKKKSEETKNKIKMSNLGKNLGKFPSQETRNKMSKSRKGKTHSKHTKEKLKLGQIGRKGSNYNPIPVLQYSLEDVFIKKWKDLISLKEAGFNKNCISKACRGKIKSSCGFKWKFEELIF